VFGDLSAAAAAGNIQQTAARGDGGESVVPGTGRAPQPGPAERTLEVMDARSEIRDFLTTRRARISPEEAGLPAYGGSRRVAGLRREEVALLAAMSVDYYTRLERGNARGASDAVLESLARALQLDEAERAHLFDLVHAASAATARAPRRASRPQVRPAVPLVSALSPVVGAPLRTRSCARTRPHGPCRQRISRGLRLAWPGNQPGPARRLAPYPCESRVGACGDAVTGTVARESIAGQVAADGGSLVPDD